MANSEFIEIISEQTKAQIDAIMPLVRELAKTIKDINNFTVSNTPSGADKNINSLNDAYKKRAESIAKVRSELEKTTAIQKQIENNAKNQTASSQKLTKAELDYVSAVERGVKAKEREVLATKKLNDAYGQLTTKRNEAARALQNSIVETGKYSIETKKLQKEFDVLNKKVGEADKAIGKFSQSNNGFQMLTSGVKNLLSAFGIVAGLGLVVDIGKNIYETTKQLQSLDLALKMVSGSQEEFADNQAFISSVSEKWGVEIKGLTEQYTKFYTASKGILSGGQIKSVFEGIAKSGALIGLSVQKQNDAFVALEQMMSKGKVTAEELRKQLGNAMPGAMRAAGMAYMELHPKIKTIQEAEATLMSDMKKGAIDSATYVPLIVKNFQKLYGIEMVNKVETLQAAQDRLANSWTNLVRTFKEGSGTLPKIVMGSMNVVTDIIKGATLLLSSEEKKRSDQLVQFREKGYEETLKYYNSLDKIKKEDLINDKAYTQEKINQETKEFNRLKGRNLILKAITPERKIGMSKEEQTALVAGEAEIAQNKEKMKALNNLLSSRYGNVKAVNELLKNEEKLKGSTTETEEEKKKREKAQKERLDDIYEMNKSQLELELTKSELILNNDIKSYEERLNALDRYNKIKTQLIELAYKHDLDSAKGNNFKEKEVASKHSKELLLQTEDYLKKRTDLFKKQYADESMDETIKELEKVQEEINKAKADLEEKSIEEQVKRMKAHGNKAIKEMTAEQKRQFEAAINSFNTFIGDFANKSGFGESFDLFGKLDEHGKTMFENLLEDGKKTEEEYKAIFLGISTAAQDSFNLISEISNRRFEEQYACLEKEKEVALKFAGESDSAKQKIEDDYEKRRKEIAKREFKAKQQQAMVNIAIDTAQAAMATLGKTGFFGIPLSAIVIAMGLAQEAIVASQKPPEYWTGTENAEAGLAWTQERGAEIITDKKGNIKDFGDSRGARLTMMEKGDKVYTASETKQMMFNNELNSLMLDNGINMPKVVVNNSGLSKSDMREVMIETLGSQTQHYMGFDKGGFYSYISKNGNITRRLEDRGNGSGLTF